MQQKIFKNMNNFVLSNFVLHLRNLIILKLLISIFIIFLLIFYNKTLQVKFSALTQYLKNLENILLEEKIKLYYATHNKEEILSNYHQYKELLENADEYNYNNLVKFMQNLAMISNKYHLKDPINLTLSKSFIKNNNIFNSNLLKIRELNIKINFTIEKLDDFIKIIDEIMTSAPHNAILKASSIEYQGVLIKPLIEKLTPAYPLNLIKVSADICIQEINNN